MGDSRGHWEGDTLVVETTNFRGRSVYRNANADRLKLIERFTRVGPNTEMEGDGGRSDDVDDAVDIRVPLTLNPSEPMMPYECHEGTTACRTSSAPPAPTTRRPRQRARAHSPSS